MKEIVINSERFGKHIVMIDDEDYELISKYTWSLLPSKNGQTYYAKTNLFNSKPASLQIHTLILKSYGLHVDHIDRNGLNNQKENLRICTRSQNMMNKIKIKPATSKYKGVCWYDKYKKWNARIGVNNRRFCLGYFDTQEDAALAYNIAAKKFHREFCRLNEIACVEQP